MGGITARARAMPFVGPACVAFPNEVLYFVTISPIEKYKRPLKIDLIIRFTGLSANCHNVMGSPSIGLHTHVRSVQSLEQSSGLLSAFFVATQSRFGGAKYGVLPDPGNWLRGKARGWAVFSVQYRKINKIQAITVSYLYLRN